MGRADKGLVLVAEDDAMIRTMTRDALELFGYRVVTAENGSGALRLLRFHGWDIDIAILDYVMPGVDGESTLRELRRIHPELPVLFCTDRVEPDLERRLRGQKAQVLTKPVRLRALIKAVEAALKEAGRIFREPRARSAR